MSFLKKLEPLALLLLRCGLALVFIYHGYPKLFGNTAIFVESFRAIGLPPTWFISLARSNSSVAWPWLLGSSPP